MSEAANEAHCSKCGRRLPPDATRGRMCPQCLMELGLAAASSEGRERPRPSAAGPHSRQIGPYKLLERIGEGGMAIVYSAEQSKPLKRKVALKILKLGIDSKEIHARFDAERQALALMDHPNVGEARLARNVLCVGGRFAT